MKVGDVVRSKRSGRAWRIVEIGPFIAATNRIRLLVVPVYAPRPVPIWSDQVDPIASNEWPAP